MTILFKCACGMRLKIADEFSGKAGKCPSCGRPFQVPTAATAPVVAPESAPNAAKGEEDLPILEPVADGPSCPSCGSALSEGDVYCVSCGYDLKAGKKGIGVLAVPADDTEHVERRARLAVIAAIAAVLLVIVLAGLLVWNERARKSTTSAIPVATEKEAKPVEQVAVNPSGIKPVGYFETRELQTGDGKITLKDPGKSFMVVNVGVPAWYLFLSEAIFQRQSSLYESMGVESRYGLLDVRKDRFTLVTAGGRSCQAKAVGAMKDGPDGPMTDFSQTNVMVVSKEKIGPDTVHEFYFCYELQNEESAGLLRMRIDDEGLVDVPNRRVPLPKPIPAEERGVPVKPPPGLGPGLLPTGSSSPSVPLSTASVAVDLPVSSAKTPQGGVALEAVGYFVTRQLPAAGGKISTKDAGRDFLSVTVRIPARYFDPSAREFRKLRPLKNGEPDENYHQVCDPLRMTLLIRAGRSVRATAVGTESQGTWRFSEGALTTPLTSSGPAGDEILTLAFAWDLQANDCVPPFKVQIDRETPIDVPDNRLVAPAVEPK